jgi:Protein of unknown function (DUF3433)
MLLSMAPRSNEYEAVVLNTSESAQPLPKKEPLLWIRPLDDVAPHEYIIRPWKPLTLTPFVLVPTVVFTALLIVALGLLQWQNARNGALFFAPTEDGFSESDLFLYRYLPTIIIVIYGSLWSWIDLDVKRLEPWYQLSKKQGVVGSQSLSLQYPLDFSAVVPIKAAKKR